MDKSKFLLLAAVLVSCASHKHDIHRTPDMRSGMIERTYVGEKGNHVDKIHYNRAILIKGVSIDETYFKERLTSNFDEGYRLYEYGSLIDSMVPGREDYLFIFRNFVGYCCDGHGAGSFQILVNLLDEKPNLSKSIVYENGHFQLPHSAWFPRSIRINGDSLYILSGNRSSGDSLELKTNIVVDSIFTVEEFKSEYSKMEKAVEE
jgi:hypothetical protein